MTFVWYIETAPEPMTFVPPKSSAAKSVVFIRYPNRTGILRVFLFKTVTP